jgi:hypothetical protein
MADPTFLVIGAQKCGTSWMLGMMRQHPDVLVAPRKEIHFFDKAENYRKGIDWYRSHFPEVAGKVAAGEFTPNYFWTSDDPREIEESGCTENIPALVAKHYPDIRLVVSLRDPVDRAVSAYYHHLRAGRVSPKESILAAKDRFGIVSMGFYEVHLRRWREHFPADQLLVLLYEEDPPTATSRRRSGGSSGTSGSTTPSSRSR